MIVVSSTSPIVNLSAIGRLDLLRQLCGNVAIPQAVYGEITAVGAGQPGATEVECRAMGASACVWEISKTPRD